MVYILLLDHWDETSNNSSPINCYWACNDKATHSGRLPWIWPADRQWIWIAIYFKSSYSYFSSQSGGVRVHLPYPNFTELLIFERSRILVIPEMVHRAVCDINNVLMLTFSVVLFHIFLGHWFSKENLGFDHWKKPLLLSSKIVMTWLKNLTTLFQGNSYCEKSTTKHLDQKYCCTMDFSFSSWSLTELPQGSVLALVYIALYIFRVFASLQI